MKSRLQVSPQKRRQQGGNVLVEFAVMAVLLLVTTLGVVDFGRMFNYGNAAYSAASAGTQYGALSAAHYGDMAGMQAAALADLEGITGATAEASQTCRCSIGGDPVSCPADCSGLGNSAAPETYITVAVTIPYSTIVTMPWIASVTQLKGSSTVRVQ